MKRPEVAELTYREMWETYVEPNLKSQEAIAKARATKFEFENNEPVTFDEQVAAAQAVGMLFGHDPLTVGKAMRKSWPPKADDIETLRAKLQDRENAAKCYRRS